MPCSQSNAFLRAHTEKQFSTEPFAEGRMLCWDSLHGHKNVAESMGFLWSGLRLTGGLLSLLHTGIVGVLVWSVR